jgi:hypothetical protein
VNAAKRSEPERSPERAAVGPMLDVAGLTAAQCAGEACVSCHKKWPRPAVPAAHLADGRVLYRCDDCVVLTQPAEQMALRRLFQRRPRNTTRRGHTRGT